MPRTPIPAAGEAVAAETRDVGDAIDVLCRAININELIYMAAEGVSDRKMQEAITTGCDVLDDILKEVKAVLYANIERKGGAS